MFAQPIQRHARAVDSPTNETAGHFANYLKSRDSISGVEQILEPHHAIGDQAALQFPAERALSQSHSQEDGVVPGGSWSFPKTPIFQPGRTNQFPPQYLLTSPTWWGVIQPKLEIGSIDDPLEHEADRLADQVMRMPNSAGHDCCGGCASGGPCEKKHATPASGIAKAPGGGTCPSAHAEQASQDEEEHSPIQPKVAKGGLNHQGSRLEAGLSASASGGAPLPHGAREFMEPRFGWDFSHVRVHADQYGAALARSINALAFTNGRDIYFAAGHYNPDSRSGAWLLAHELSHVVQQRGGSQGQLMRYSLDNFPKDEAERMNISIPSAQSMVSTCTPLPAKKRKNIFDRIGSVSYKYEAEEKNCGVAHSGFLGIGTHVTIGPKAFDVNQCCFLGSTIAHEAGHLEGLDETDSRALECTCAQCCP
jgi:Domain of unknown function (DUF4157)